MRLNTVIVTPTPMKTMPKNTASEDPLVSKITQKEITREIMPNPGEGKNPENKTYKICQRK